jgi:hypothetical protein
VFGVFGGPFWGNPPPPPHRVKKRSNLNRKEGRKEGRKNTYSQQPFIFVPGFCMMLSILFSLSIYLLNTQIDCYDIHSVSTYRLMSIILSELLLKKEKRIRETGKFSETDKKDLRNMHALYFTSHLKWLHAWM